MLQHFQRRVEILRRVKVSGDFIASVRKSYSVQQLLLTVPAAATILGEGVAVESVISRLRELPISDDLFSQSLVQNMIIRLQQSHPILLPVDLLPSLCKISRLLTCSCCTSV
jgi:hypothetical protein